MDGRCNSENVLYQASIFPMENRSYARVYVVFSAGNWKQRLYDNRHSFINPLLKNQTVLSKYFLRLKESGRTEIKWKITRKSLMANSFSSKCNLCMEEKISIINHKDTRQLLNKGNKLIFKCPHKNRVKST